jgi:hypothetical protein
MSATRPKPLREAKRSEPATIPIQSENSLHMNRPYGASRQVPYFHPNATGGTLRQFLTMAIDKPTFTEGYAEAKNPPTG